MNEWHVMPATQRRAADPTRSVWVAASAGTGKTKVLVDRILNLLLAGAEPHRLLCLTFTKAAAKEMSLRLAERLGRWAVVDDAALANEIRMLTESAPDAKHLASARKLFARVLDAPGGLRIDTIHAFCQSLLRRFPLEAGLNPHFQVLDEANAGELLRGARDTVLVNARASADSPLAGALQLVIALTSEHGFGEIIGELVRERPRIGRLLLRHGGEIGLLGAVRARMGLAGDEGSADVLAAACDDGAIEVDALRRAAWAMLAGQKTDRDIGAKIERWLAARSDRLALFDEYASAFLTQTGARRARLVTRDVTAAAPETEETLAREAARLIAARTRLKDASNAEATAALLCIAARLLDAYDAAKRATGALDYDDLIVRARDLLQSPGVAPWILFKLDGGIDHVLIDEAQDTNPEQWEVAAAIAEDFFAGAGAREVLRTIFAVGDTKQSIFGFQRADPQAFVDMRDHFSRRAREAKMEFASVPLQLSYRSTRAVLAAVDAVFALPQAQDGVALDGVEIRHDSFRTGEAGLVELWPPMAPRAPQPRAAWAQAFAVEPGDSPRRRLAERIADEVARWIGEGEMLESQGRPIRAGDVMILVRRRNSLVEELVRAFKARDIPVAGVDRMVLAEQLAIMDLVALGRFLLLPGDDLTLATVLKGPLFGFDDDLLFALAQPRPGTLWAELRRRANENPRFATAEAELSRLRARADFAPPYELFAELLSAQGGRSRIVARLGSEAEDPLDEFLAACLAFERTHTPSLEGFLHWLEAGAQEIKRDLEEGSREEVRIMTVHGAKGLQAPIVFLPDTLQSPTRTPALLWFDDLVVWSPRADDDGALAAAARNAARKARDAEHRRLLYVAMTRARDRLYICGYLTNRSAPEGCWYKLIEPALRAIGQPATIDLGQGETGPGLRLVCPQERPAMPTSTPAVAADATALPRWASEPAPREPSPAKPLVPSAPAEIEPAVRSPFGADDGARFKRGRLIHRLLQSLPDLAPAKRPRAAAAFLARKVHGLLPAERNEIARETLAIFAKSDFTALFGPASRAEAPIVGRVGERVISGQVDRLCVLPDEVLIVDYKTNRPPPESPSRVPELYYTQMAAYRAALGRIYPGRKIRCALLWTVGPRLMELPQAALDRFAPGG